MAECKECRFWSVVTAGGAYQGQCKRHAPTRDTQVTMTTIYVDAPSNRALWPLTRPDDGCGDHEPLPKKQEET